MPWGVAALVLAGVTLLGGAAAGGAWWLTNRRDPVSVAAAAPEAGVARFDAGGSWAARAPDARAPEAATSDARDDGTPGPDAATQRAALPVHVASSVPLPPARPPAPVLAPSPPPAASSPGVPAATRSVADLAYSPVPADEAAARRVLEPKVVGRLATMEDVRELLHVCTDQHDSRCEKMCKRVLAGKNP